MLPLQSLQNRVGPLMGDFPDIPIVADIEQTEAH